MEQPGLTATTLLKRLLQASVKATGLTQYEPIASDEAAAIFTKWKTLLGITGGVSPHTHLITDIVGLSTSLNSKANTSSLAAVAFSGQYSDLLGIPGLGADLTNLEALTTVGIAVRTNVSGAWATRSLVSPADGIAITNPDGTAGNPSFALNHDVAAVEALSTFGIVRRTALDTWSAGVITVEDLTDYTSPFLLMGA